MYFGNNAFCWAGKDIIPHAPSPDVLASPRGADIDELEFV